MIDIMGKECFLDMVYENVSSGMDDKDSRYFETTEFICEEAGAMCFLIIMSGK